MTRIVEEAGEPGSAEPIDLRGLEFARFVDYVFDRPVPQSRSEVEWFLSDEEDRPLLVDPAVQIEHATRLFSEPAQLLPHFTPVKIDQGFWFLAGWFQPDFFAGQLWNRDLPVPQREGCVRAMETLHRRLFAQHPLGKADTRWWDLLRDSAPDEPLERARNSGALEGTFADPGNERIRRAIVEVLGEVLALPAPHCQRAALHGISLWGTAQERVPAIDGYLRSHPGLDADLHDYALHSRAGKTLR